MCACACVRVCVCFLKVSSIVLVPANIFKHVEFMSVRIWGGCPMRGENLENFYLLLALSLPVLPLKIL